MKLALIGLLALAPQLVFGGLEQYQSLVRADKGQSRPDSIRVTYLGVNGYALEADGRFLLIDPYFTRASFPNIAFNQPLTRNETRIRDGLSQVRGPVDAILVTHSHFDHLLDVPFVMKEKRAPLIGDEMAVRLANAAGAPPGSRPAKANTTRHLPPWTIHVLPAAHDRLFGKVPYSGNPGGGKPEKAHDWVLGEPFAFLVEANGKSVYVESGGVPDQLPALRGKKVDLAIISVALPDSRKRYADVVRKLEPRFVQPSHQDNMFQPAANGFSFGPLSDFTSVRRTHRQQKLPGELILLDYFRPWTIP